MREPIYRRLEQPVHGLAKDQVQQDRNRVRREPLQDVEEQRNASERDEEIANNRPTRLRT